MEAIKGRRQNWKQEANLLHVRERMEEARPKGVPASRAGEQHRKARATRFSAALQNEPPCPSHYMTRELPGQGLIGMYLEPEKEAPTGRNL